MDRVDERALLRELGARRDNFEFAQKEALRAARELSILQRIHGWWGSGMVEKIAEVNGMRRMLFFAEPSWPMSPASPTPAANRSAPPCGLPCSPAAGAAKS